MFLGIFSSIIPYLIAGGFYLAWLLFSLVQPILFHKKATQIPDKPLLKITTEESTQKVKPEENYYFEDYIQDVNQPETDVYSIQGEIQFYPKFLSTLYTPQKEKIFRKLFIHSRNFTRPPPFC